MTESIRRRIEALEAAAPKSVVLYLKDGSEFYHRGPALEFYADAMRQIHAGRGALADAVRNAVGARGCGRLWEVLQAVAQ